MKNATWSFPHLCAGNVLSMRQVREPDETCALLLFAIVFVRTHSGRGRTPLGARPSGGRLLAQ